MAHLFFSMNSLIGSELVAEDGTTIGTLVDVISNKEEGELTFILLEASACQQTEERLFAIHHSFFRLLHSDTELVFSPGFGQEGKEMAKASLPEYYRSNKVGDYVQFQNEILKELTGAGHRSDNQIG